MTKHYLLGPSSASRWIPCPGSLFGPELPYEDSPSARQGTACHALLETCLVWGSDPKEMLGHVFPDIPEFPVDEEMVDAVNLCIKTIHDECDALGIPRSAIVAEQTLVHSAIPNELFGGTADCYAAGESTLLVVDLKYGRKTIYANSPQLTAYALLVLDKLGRPFDRIVQVLVQPRIGNVDRYELGRDDITAVWDGITRAAALVVENDRTGAPPEGSLKTGGHCDYCRRKSSCPAFNQSLTELVDTGVTNADRTPLSVTTGEMPVETLVRWQEFEDAIGKFFDQVRKELLVRASRGESIPGRKLVARYGHRRWTDTDEVMLARFPKMLGISSKDLKEVRLKSPAQVEKVLKASGKLPALQKKIDKYTVSPPAGVKLVSDRAKGEAIRPETAVEFLKALEETSDD